MSEPTEIDLTFLENEEATRTFMHFVTPLIQQAVREESALAREEVKTELFNLRTDIQTKQGDFATHDEVTSVGDKIGDKVSTSLLNKVGEWFDNEAKARVKWQEEIASKYERRFEQLAPLEDVHRLTASVQAVIDRQTTLEATTATRLTTHDNRLNKVEDTQKAQLASAEKIKANTDAVATNTVVIRKTVEELVRRDKKHQAEIDRLRDSLRSSDDQTARDIDLIQDDMRKQEVRLIKTEAELQPIAKVAGAFLKLFTTRRGNLVLAGMALFFFGFQIVNAWLTYQFIQRIPMLAN